MWAADRIPTPEEQERFLEATRERALAYTLSLPDFICTQRVRRYSWIPGANFRRNEPGSVLTVRLSYSRLGEKYTLVALNGIATNLPYEELGGSTSQGEFGSLLVGIMNPLAKGKFKFERWGSLDGRRITVYSYRVPGSEASSFRLRYRDEATGDIKRTQVGQEGELFIEAESNAILRVRSTATDIPKRFPIRSSTTIVSYGYREISGRRYLLPTEAEIQMTTGRMSHRNQIEFLNYQKFSSDSTVRFERTDSTIDYKGEESDKR